MKNVVYSVSKFLSEVKFELTRIEWPTFNEFIGSTFVVLIIVSAFSLYLGIVDKAILILMTKLLAYGA